MGDIKEVDQMSLLINELLKGKELAMKLMVYLQYPPASSSSSSSPLLENQEEHCLIEKILACFNYGLSVANPTLVPAIEPNPDTTTATIYPMSPEGSTQYHTNHHGPRQHLQSASNNRKSLPRWTRRIPVGPGTLLALEGPLDDGYCWRKYGQKDILGAKFPRGYYRCTHRNTRGCLATKLVQRTDEDSSVTQVIYRGLHTCNHASLGRRHHHQSPSSQLPVQLNLEPTNTIVDQNITQLSENQDLSPPLAFNNSGTASQQLRVKIEGLDVVFPSFAFSSASPRLENVENISFYPENTMADSFHSPAFNSSEMSESNYFPPALAVQSSVSGHYEGVESAAASNANYEGVASAAASNTNSPISGAGFSYDHLVFDLLFDDHQQIFSP